MSLKSGHLLCILTPLFTSWDPMDLSITSLCLSFLICELLIRKYPLMGGNEMTAYMGITWHCAWCSVNNTH